jgi:hypothetical protein
MTARILAGAAACIGAFLLTGLGGTARGAQAPEEWHFVMPLPQGYDLHAIWAAAADDLYVGGDSGTIYHWDGTMWSKMKTPTTKQILSIHGRSATDIWAVGGDPHSSDPLDMSLVLHFDGTSWTEMPVPNYMGLQTYPLTCVHAVGPNDVLATTNIGTALPHWNGTEWSFINMPFMAYGSFSAIDSVDADHVFVVGSHGQILHRDHGTWKLEQQTETGGFSTNLLQSVWAPALDTVRTTGNFDQVYARKADGTWEEQNLSSGCTSIACDSAIFIGGNAADDIFLVGGDNVRHYDGTPPPIHRDDYVSQGGWSAACMAGGRLFMAGSQGRIHEYAFDGESGTGTLSPLSVGKRYFAINSLRNIGMAGYGDCGFLLFGNTTSTSAWPLQIYDGTGFTPFPTLPAGVPQAVTVTAASAAGPDDVVADFFSFTLPNTVNGTYRWDGETWAMMGDWQQNPKNVIDYWRNPADNGIYALTAGGVTRFDGTNWITVGTSADLGGATLTCFWGRADDDLYVGTQDGRIWRYDGSAWTEESVTDATGPINAIAGADNETFVYAFGAANTALYRNAAANWAPVGGLDSATGSGDFVSAIGTGTAVYACQTPASGGRIWRISNARATLKMDRLPSPANSLEFARTGSGAIYALGKMNFDITILADRKVQERLTMKRLDLSSTDWSAFGSTGVGLHPETAGTASPMVAVWSVPASAGFLPDPENLLPAARTWAIAGENLPPLFARFELDSGDWPADFDYKTASLYHHGSAAAWELVPTTASQAAPVLETTGPSEMSSWTYAGSGSGTAPELRVESIRRAPDGSVQLQWTDLGAAYRYTVQVSESLDGTWTPAPGTAWPVSGTTWTDSSTGAAEHRFYQVEAVEQP